MVKVILVSGNKPRSGKGTVAKFLTEYCLGKGYTCQTLEFKDKLFEITADFLGITVEEFLDGYEDKAVSYAEKNALLGFNLWGDCEDIWWKDVPLYQHNTGMLSKRQALIYVSENIIKPHTSEDYFGKKLLEKIDPDADFVFVPDSGFSAEALPVINSVGKDNVLVVNLIRTVGENNIKDSRKMLTPEDFDYKLRPDFTKVENNRTLEDLRETLYEKVVSWMDWRMIQ